MREVKILTDSIGRFFGLKPEDLGHLHITQAIDITSFCSRDFTENGNQAIVEFGIDGDKSKPVVHFKTRYRGSGPNAGLTSVPYSYLEFERKKLHKVFFSSSGSLLQDWGINPQELIDLIFKYSPETITE